MDPFKNDPGKKDETPMSHSPATQIEIATTKNEKQKAELAEELFPPTQRKKRMRTRRILH